MLLFPHTALLAFMLSLLGYAPGLPDTHMSKPHPACYSDTFNLDAFGEWTGTCPLYNSTFSAPLFGSLEHHTTHSAFAAIRTAAAATAPAVPVLPTFTALPFYSPLATVNALNSSSSSSSHSSSPFQVLLLHGSSDPFSLRLLSQFERLARRFPRVQFLAVDCTAEGDEALYALHRHINTTITMPLPLLSPAPAVATLSSPALAITSNSSSLSGESSSLSRLTSGLLSFARLPSLPSSGWWSAAPSLPPPPAAAPSLSFPSHYLVRGLPTLLLFHRAAVLQHSNSRWPRDTQQLAAHIAHATGGSPQWMEDEMYAHKGTLFGQSTVEGQTEADYVEEDDDDQLDVDEEEDWEQLFDVTNELDWGLLCGVLGMSLVHWLHRLKDKLDRWEVEALAMQHG